jgi:hypothetical protein
LDGLLLRLDILGLRLDGARLLLHHRRCHRLRGGLRLRLGLCNLSLELGLGLDNSLRLRLHDLRMHGLGLYGLRLQLRLAG